MSLLKQVNEKGGTTAWSPIQTQSDVIAVGTRLGAGGGFEDYGGELSLYKLGLENSSTDMKEIAKTKTATRFNCLAWGSKGGNMGILAGGMQNGVVNLWDPEKLSRGNDTMEPIAVVNKHQAKVGSLQFNPHPSTAHLLATGASDKEVYIVDIKSPTAPTVFSPGVQKHSASVTSVAWNPQVVHILASASGDGVCTVWDLRKKAPWTELRDPKGSGFSAIAWNPDGGVHLITATDDDSRPVMRLWDLRSPNSHLSELKGHSKEIYSVSWCPHDSGMLVSCGKDNKTILWDMYNSQPIFELDHDENEGPSDVQANANPGIGGGAALFGGVPNAGAVFGGGQIGGIAGGASNRRYQVQWSPLKKSLLSTCSFDRSVQIFSMNGAGSGSDAGLVGESGQPIRKHAPKWCGRRCGATFGFGGTLIKFGAKPAGAAGEASTFNSEVTLCEYISEPSLVQQSRTFDQNFAQAAYVAQQTFQQQQQLQMQMQQQGIQQTEPMPSVKQSYKQLCDAKSKLASTQEECDTWKYMSILFEADARQEILSLLGYDAEEIKKLVPTVLQRNIPEPIEEQPAEVQQPPEQLPEPIVSTPPVEAGQQQANGIQANDLFGDAQNTFDQPAVGAEDTFDEPAPAVGEQQPEEKGEEKPFEEPEIDGPPPETRLSQLSNTTNYSNSSVDTGTDVPVEVPTINFRVPTDEVEQLLRKTLLIGNFEAAVDCCLANGLLSDALLLATCGGPELWEETRQFYLEKQCEVRPGMKLVGFIISGDLKAFIEQTEIANGKWQEALAILSSYAQSNEFTTLCDMLAMRLENELGDQGRVPATLCYMCAMNVEKTVSIWVDQCIVETNNIVASKTGDKLKPMQSLVEKIVIFQQAIANPKDVFLPTLLNEYLTYVENLVAQGLFESAATYLSPLNVDPFSLSPELQPMYIQAAALCDRVQNGYRKGALLFQQQPVFPYQVVAPDVYVEPVQPVQQQAVPNAQQSTMGAQQQQQMNPLGNNAFNQPQTNYNAPNTGFNPPQNTFQPTAPVAAPTTNSYTAPQFGQPGQGFGAPQNSFAPPPAPVQTQVQPPAPKPATPAPTYVPPATNFQPPPQQQQSTYAPPSQSFQQPTQAPPPPTPSSYNTWQQPTPQQNMQGGGAPPPPPYNVGFSPQQNPYSGTPMPSQQALPPNANNFNQAGIPPPPPPVSMVGNPAATNSIPTPNSSVLQKGPEIKENDGFGSTAGNPVEGAKYGNFTAAPAPKQEEPQAPVPAGKLPDEMQPAVQAFQKCIEQLGAIAATGAEKKQVDEASKALQVMIEKLKRSQIGRDVMDILLELGSNIASNQFVKAQQLVVDLTRQYWAEHKDWLKGSKYLTTMAVKKLQG